MTREAVPDEGDLFSVELSAQFAEELDQAVSVIRAGARREKNASSASGV
jgi:hypothetical protein